jgi:hypothetical protein
LAGLNIFCYIIRMTDSESGFNPELQERVERATVRLVELARELGFIQTAEMAALMAQVNSQNAYELAEQWHVLAERQAESVMEQGDEPWRQAQAGLLIAKAALALKAGYREEFFCDIEDAVEYTSGKSIGLTRIAEALKDISNSFWE